MSILQKLKNEITSQADNQDEVQDLEIDDIKIEKFTPEIAALFSHYPELSSLALTNCSLKTLEGFPRIANLENLLLETNSLDGSAVKFIGTNFKKLVCLSLAENQIKTFEELEPLKELTNLQQLDLSDNPIASLPGYHAKVFKLLTNLKVLDNKDEKGEEMQYTDDDDDDGANDDLEDEDFDQDEDDEPEEDEEDDDEDKPAVKKPKK